ncbi:MAG TPA: BNR-4 repeat-containing protein [Thermoguttaceae bacterium]|nr:BNR-4 repeat-containing protein [Thermoguttaceae bacterium]
MTNFNGGNSTGVVDGYQGMVGDGWLDTWQTNTTRASMASTMVSATSPLSGGGNYLDVSINMDSGVSDSYTGQGCVARTYNDYYGDFSAALSHTIQFQVRIDDTLGSFTTSNDRFYFYDNPTLTSGTSADNTWSIYAFGANYGSALAKKWAFYNGSQDGGAFDQYSLVNTGMTITSGATYTFTISVDPDNKLYNASVTNGTTTSTINGLGFRTDIAQVGRMLHFGGKGNQSAENRDFSLDSILIPDNGATEPPELPTADGFRGIWYSITSLGAPYYYKYSGGFATYPQQINPHSFYSAEANKTFFVYGGTNASNSTIYHMISYYDHATGQVARPRILLDKGTTDAHDNPSLIMDKEGYIYVFSSAHSVNRPSYISRSVQPYEINRFETVATLPAGYDNNFSYAQPFYIPGQGFLLLHTLYVDTPEYSVDERVLCYNTSSDGIHWNYNWETRPRLAQISGGQYQISNAHGQKISTAFNWHENGDGNARTNLYYMQTTNLGATWTTAGGALLSTPVTTAANAALVHDYASENLLVYLKNIEYDAGGNPIIFYLTTDYYLPGPAGDPRMFHTAHWTGSTWAIKDVFTTDHNYDYGPLYVEDDGTWRIIAPTDAGPQPGCTGGEMEMWVSHDEGTSWQKIRELTYDSDYNHTYARQPRNANDDFYSFWADGNAYAESESRLYFTDRLGTGVWKLPEYMEGDFATPELAYSPIGAPGPGDANGDGDVDHEDAAIISAHWMQSDWATWADGDFNRDGEVNALDASILAANWGSHTGAGESLSVPEPSGMMLLLGLVCLPFARRPHAA